MKTLHLLGVVALLIAGTVQATIINVPDDQPTIQAGINAAADGDTVLVQPDTYVENINYNGKNIVVGSVFLTTQDTSYISQTVIDGNQNGSVVTFNSGEALTAVLSGLTITNGLGDEGGGICCWDGSDPSLENLIVSGNTADDDGGGIYCYWGSNPSIENVTVCENVADEGGGIYCYESDPTLENVTVSENVAKWGGGIYCFGGANPILKNVTVSANVAEWGGGIYCERSVPYFDSIDRCNIHSNNALAGNDLCAFLDPDWPPIAVVVDTFTVMNPTDQYALPAHGFTFDILHAQMDLVDSDLYVSPDGDDNNSGQSPAEPLRTVRHAFSMIYVDSLHPHTVNLANGVYGPSTNGETFPLCVLSHVSLHGESEAGVILDAEDQSSVMAFWYSQGSSIQNLTVTGGWCEYGEDYPDGEAGGILCVYSSPALTDVTVSGNWSSELGGGITCIVSSPSLENVTVSGNTGESGGGIGCFWESSPTLENMTVSGNTAKGGGGIVCIWDSNPTLNDVTVSGNTADDGGGIGCAMSDPNLANVTVSQNIAREGGGGIIFCGDSNPILNNVTVSGNAAGIGGGGICCVESSPSFDPVNRCNIYLNNAVAGNDLYAVDCPPIAVVVDTFTVMNPTDYHAYPVDSFTFDILHSKVEQVAADLYVSPDGDDANSGLTPGDPLHTISLALSMILADSLDPHTIHLAEGVYSSSTNDEHFPLGMVSHVSLSGESETSVTLDAEGQLGVIGVAQGQGIIIDNLTITGGSCDEGGGIWCEQSNLNVQNVTISGNTAANDGGGIWCQQSSLSLQHVTVSANAAEDGSGGGIRCWESSLSLANVAVSGNMARYRGGGIICGGEGCNPVLNNVLVSQNIAGSRGGGIYCEENSSPSLECVTITNNAAGYSGGGIYCYESSPVFDPDNRCSIYLNHAAVGNDFYAYFYHYPPISIVVDTFTVVNPTNYHAFPVDNLTFDILHGKVEQVAADLYVSPDGDDSNSGLSSAEPLGTISFALVKILADSLDPRTIYLAGGIYSPSTNDEHFPLGMVSYVSLSGESETSVVLDAEDQLGVVGVVQGQGITVDNLTITGGSCVDNGGGIWCEQSSLGLQYVTVSGNRANIHGGGIWCEESNLDLAYVTIRDNTAEYDGGGVLCGYQSSLSLINAAINGNTAGYAGYGSGGGIGCRWGSILSLVNGTISGNMANEGGGIFCGGSSLVIVNTILWNDSPQEINPEPDSITVVYSDIQGGWPGEGNKDANPLFVDAANGDYHLSDASPCISAGTDSIQIDGTWYYAPPTDIEGNPRPNPPGSSPDMGAYESPEGVGVERLDPNAIPECYELGGNYPNPFGSVTTIHYQLPEPSLVKFSVYDLNGRLVETLVNESMEPGYYSIRWDANEFSSGVYVFRLEAGEFSETRKCVLLR